MARVIDMELVDSANISSIGFGVGFGRGGTNVLRVCFKNGSCYTYSPVPLSTWESRFDFGSIGKWFHSEIRSNVNISSKRE